MDTRRRPPRFLIVTADDFGAHECVNDAVERAHCSGILTAASLMVAGPACADAVIRARRLPTLRIGLHLVLADGRATLPPQLIPDLVDANGWFDSDLPKRAIRLFAQPRVRRQVEAEIRAQFERFARTGLALDHVNAHKHFHLHPTLLRIILNVGQEFGVRAIRVPREPAWFSQSASRWLLEPWVALLRRHVQLAGMSCNDHVFGIARSGRMDERTLLQIFQHFPDGVTEIYLHPAMRPDYEAATSGYRHADELAALLSARVAAAVESLDITRGGYADLPHTGFREPRATYR